MEKPRKSKKWLKHLKTDNKRTIMSKNNPPSFNLPNSGLDSRIFFFDSTFVNFNCINFVSNYNWFAINCNYFENYYAKKLQFFCIWFEKISIPLQFVYKKNTKCLHFIAKILKIWIWQLCNFLHLIWEENIYLQFNCKKIQNNSIWFVELTPRYCYNQVQTNCK